MDYLLKTDENYPFNQLKLHSPQPIQGGTYLAKISRSEIQYYFKHLNAIKRGIHKTEKRYIVICYLIQIM